MQCMNLGWILNWRKIIWDIFVKNGGTWLHILDGIMELLSNFLDVITVLLYSKMSISLGDAYRNKKEWNIIMYMTLKLFSKKRERKKNTVVGSQWRLYRCSSSYVQVSEHLQVFKIKFEGKKNKIIGSFL